MDVKLKTKDDFNNYYQNEYKNIISNYYEMLKENKKRNIILGSIFYIIISIVFVLAVDVLNLKSVLTDYFNIVAFSYFIIFLIITVCTVYSLLKKEMVNLNNDILKDIIAFISDTNKGDVVYEPKMMLSTESLDKMELFNLDVVKYSGNNYIKAIYNKNCMVFSDISTFVYDIVETKKDIYKNGKKYIRTTRKKVKRPIYNGMYIGATLNKNNSNHIYLIPNNLKDRVLQSKIMSYIKFSGVPVMLENLEFSKKYKVFCNDEVQARYILSLGLMEKINKIDEVFSGKKYIVFKEGKRFAICIEGLSIEQIKNKALTPFRNDKKEMKILTEVFSELNKLFSIYHILDLENDLYDANKKPMPKVNNPTEYDVFKDHNTSRHGEDLSIYMQRDDKQ